MNCFLPCRGAEELANGSFAPPSRAYHVPMTSILPDLAMNKIYRVVAVGPMFSKHKETPYNARLDRPLKNNLIRRKVSYIFPPTLYGGIKTFQMNILKRHQNISQSRRGKNRDIESCTQERGFYPILPF